MENKNENKQNTNYTKTVMDYIPENKAEVSFNQVKNYLHNSNIKREQGKVSLSGIVAVADITRAGAGDKIPVYLPDNCEIGLFGRNSNIIISINKSEKSAVINELVIDNLTDIMKSGARLVLKQLEQAGYDITCEPLGYQGRAVKGGINTIELLNSKIASMF